MIVAVFKAAEVTSETQNEQDWSLHLPRAFPTLEEEVREVKKEGTKDEEKERKTLLPLYLRPLAFMITTITGFEVTRGVLACLSSLVKEGKEEIEGGEEDVPLMYSWHYHKLELSTA